MAKRKAFFQIKIGFVEAKNTVSLSCKDQKFGFTQNEHITYYFKIVWKPSYYFNSVNIFSSR